MFALDKRASDHFSCRFQSLIVTCRLHGIDVYTYLVDVLQRVSIHPAKEVIDLTPRVWETKFSHAPMKSDITLADQ